jgi:hypothetical protein
LDIGADWLRQQTIYLRTDGQDIASNPTLRQQLDRDRIACQGELEDNKVCMAIKGYVSVRKDQAAANNNNLPRSLLKTRSAKPSLCCLRQRWRGRLKQLRLKSRNQTRFRPL